jgi:lysylphosphatidylglycerol synthetase-like protein (DUF2156 family)
MTSTTPASAEESRGSDKVESLSYAYGATYDSYLINDGNRSHFFTQDREALLGYIRDAGCVHVIGGLLAKDAEGKAGLLRDFLAALPAWGVSEALFHNILEEDLPLFRHWGMEATKCGEEAVIDLREADWTGSGHSWVRRQENYCRRIGLRAEELVLGARDSPDGTHVFRELECISSGHIKRTTAGKEFGYFAGRLNLKNPKRRRVFMAKSARRIEAFIGCNPGRGGEFYAIEMYRYREDAPRGVMPFLWMQALRQFQAEGIGTASLCMMPFFNCRPKYPDDNAFLRHCNVFWFRHLNWLFNARGLHHFKSRFRPAGRPMFTVAYPRTSLSGLASAFKLWGLASALNPQEVARRMLRG